jgi:hypothetical protein
VDVFDLADLALHWGQTRDPNADSADFNGDWTVDVYDLALLAGNWADAVGGDLELIGGGASGEVLAHEPVAVAPADESFFGLPAGSLFDATPADPAVSPPAAVEDGDSVDLLAAELGGTVVEVAPLAEDLSSTGTAPRALASEGEPVDLLNLSSLQSPLTDGLE